MSNGESTLPSLEVLKGLEKFADHGFEFLLAAIGVVLIFSGLIPSPGTIMSANELLLLAATGVLSLGSAVVVWFRKNQPKAELYVVELTYKRLVALAKTTPEIR